jgi:hypothetical protein
VHTLDDHTYHLDRARAQGLLVDPLDSYVDIARVELIPG